MKEGRVLLIWHKRHREWLPPGGHVKENETPNDAVVREVYEETGLEIELLDNRLQEPLKSVKRHLAVPFFADVHNVGDHDHCCFYYLARPKVIDQQIQLNLNEVENCQWFAESELHSNGIPQDVMQISRIALAHRI